MQKRVDECGKHINGRKLTRRPPFCIVWPWPCPCASQTHSLAHTRIEAQASDANCAVRSYKHWHPTKNWRTLGGLRANTCSAASPWPAVRDPPTMWLEKLGGRARSFLSGLPDAASAANEASDGRAYLSIPQLCAGHVTRWCIHSPQWCWHCDHFGGG